MAKEQWLSLAIIGLILLLPLMVAIKKQQLFDTRPDQKVTYKTLGEQELSLHIFRAKVASASPKHPAVLFFHGGGWAFGAAEFFYPQCEFLAAHGFTCISAQYRLGPEQAPDVRGAVEDARDAFAYLVAHADALNIDPHRIAAGGGSAGGQLAAALGTAVLRSPEVVTSKPEQRPAALVLYNPILDFSPGTLNHHVVDGYWKEVSVIHHIDETVPPTLILSGSEDPEVPVATVEGFCQKVMSAGGRCEAEIYKDQGHGFFNQPEYLEKTNLRVLQFLSTLIK